ncbi:hypothetical protein [Paracoccus sp. SSK6]|uniref:hypothetical protein n=1 Tax=Paracoccus sp. SSK6 TaxID=3143131 RepID=UPI00321B74AA
MLGVLDPGSTIDSPDGTVERWINIATGGHVARRNLRQAEARFSDPPLDSVMAVNDAILTATRQWDGIQYGMGCKAWIKGDDGLSFTRNRSCNGDQVDCSGWVAAIMTLAGRRFSVAQANTTFRILETHSDGQIVNVGRHTGIIVSGTDIDRVGRRAGMIFGIDTGQRRHDTPDRLLGIDHIVAGFHAADGTYMISQSSGGKGVNALSWTKWRAQFDTAFRENRVHCADLMSAQAGAGLAPGDGGWSLDGGAGLSHPDPVFDKEPVRALAG